MPLPVNKSKLRGERSKLFFNFADILDFGETLATWNVTATPIVGTDTQANEMVFLLQETTPTTAIQYVVVGEPGVIYEFRCEALTSLGRTLIKEQTLAVLPSVSLFPPLLGAPFTSPPYPVEIIGDAVEASMDALDGTLKVLFVNYGWLPEAVETQLTCLGGQLRQPLITYDIKVEAIDATISLLPSTLRTILISYVVRPEAIDAILVPVNGTLVAILITTSIRPEAIDATLTPLGGTLA